MFWSAIVPLPRSGDLTLVRQRIASPMICDGKQERYEQKSQNKQHHWQRFVTMRRTRKVIPKPDALSEFIDTFSAYAPKRYFSSGDFCRDIRLLYHWLNRADMRRTGKACIRTRTARQGKAKHSKWWHFRSSCKIRYENRRNVLSSIFLSLFHCMMWKS